MTRRLIRSERTLGLRGSDKAEKLLVAITNCWYFRGALMSFLGVHAFVSPWKGTKGYDMGVFRRIACGRVGIYDMHGVWGYGSCFTRYFQLVGVEKCCRGKMTISRYHLCYQCQCLQTTRFLPWELIQLTPLERLLSRTLSKATFLRLE